MLDNYLKLKCLVYVYYGLVYATIENMLLNLIVPMAGSSRRVQSVAMPRKVAEVGVVVPSGPPSPVPIPASVHSCTELASSSIF